MYLRLKRPGFDDHIEESIYRRCFHHSKIVQCMCEVVAVQSIITVQEDMGKTLVNDENGSGMDRETVCGV